MECRSCTEFLTALLDSELTPELRSAVEVHLADCPACREELQSLALVGSTASGLTDLEPSPELWQRIAARLEPERVALPRFSRRESWWIALTRPWIPLTAVAGLLGGFFLYGLLAPSRQLEHEFATYLEMRELKANQNRLVLFDRARYQRYQPERNPFIQPVESKSNPFRSASR